MELLLLSILFTLFSFELLSGRFYCFSCYILALLISVNPKMLRFGSRKVKDEYFLQSKNYIRSTFLSRFIAQQNFYGYYYFSGDFISSMHSCVIYESTFKGRRIFLYLGRDLIETDLGLRYMLLDLQMDIFGAVWQPFT